ncbi:MAG TPA: hypothetical protein VG095_10575 [Chthoniobacterales bacterium]|nr:hypothetical protein [Chthoniobacterales bacterium]
MIRSALAVASVLFALSAAALAERTAEDAETYVPEDLTITGEVETKPALSLYRPDLFSTVDSTLLIHGLPVLTLLDGRRFPISSELGRMGFMPPDVFPVAFLRGVDVYTHGAHPRYGSDAPGGVVDLRLNRNYTGGEIGFFYGRSDGKYEREDFHAYIIGGTGNDKFQITVGAAYHESSGHIPVRHR